MEFEGRKCPNCGGELRLSEDNRKLRCDWCDTEIMVPPTEKEAPKLNGLDIKNKLILAEVEYKSGNSQKAYRYYLEVLELDATNSKAWLGRGKTTPNLPEMLECFKKCIKFSTQDDKEKIEDNIANWVNDVVDKHYSILKNNIQKKYQDMSKDYVWQILINLFDLQEFAHQCSPQHKETMNKIINMCKENIEGINYKDYSNLDTKGNPKNMVINFKKEDKDKLREKMNLFIGKIKQIDSSYRAPKIKKRWWLF